MTAVTELTGKDGVIEIAGSEVAMADFSITIDRSVATQPRVGKYSDRKKAGKVDVTGSLTALDIDGGLLMKLIGGSASDSAASTLLVNTELTGNDAREEVTITTDPTNPAPVTVRFQRIDLDTTAADCVLIGTDADGNALSEEFDVPALTTANSPWTHEGTSVFETCDYLSVGAGLETGTASNTHVKITATTGTRTVTLSAGDKFNLKGKGQDSSSNLVQIEIANAFFTSGSLNIGDADTFIDGPMTFTMEDPDADLLLHYST